MGDLLSLFGSSKDESVDFSEDETSLFFQIGARRTASESSSGSFSTIKPFFQGKA